MNLLSLIAKDSFRYWSHRPLLAITGILLLAMGTAAVSVLWIITDTIVRKPLPFPEPERLMGIQSLELKTGETLETIAIADFKDFLENSESFEGLVGYRGDFLNFESAPGETTQIFAARLTSDFEKVFQVKLVLGNLFSAEHFNFGNDSVALVSHRFWERYLDSDPNVVGRSIRFDQKMYQVIGVLPQSYKEPAFSDVWMPFPNGSPEYFVRDSRYWNAVGRLKAEISASQAQLELQRIAKTLEESFPKTNRNRSVSIKPLQEILVGDFKTPLYLMLGAVGLVMFATCFNLANLQMMSGLQRRQETSVRLALGERNSLLFARSFGESFAISTLGGGLGWLLSGFVLQRMDRILPPFFLPRIHELVDAGSVVGIVCLIVGVTGLIFGGIPALHASRSQLFQSLKSGETRHTLSVGEKRLRDALLALQVIVMVVMLHAALVSVREYRELKSLDLGFDEGGLLAVAISPSERTIADLRNLSAYYQRIEEWLESQPDVLEVTSASSPPMWGFDFEMAFDLRGRDLVVERDMPATVLYNSVSIDFFDVMKVSMREGRGFNQWDTSESARVVLVNQAFVDAYLDGQNPLEQEVKIMPWMEFGFRRVIGVVEGLKQGSLNLDIKPEVFAPNTQTPWIFTSFLVRTRDLPEKRIHVLRSALSKQYPDLGVTIIAMDDLLSGQLARAEMVFVLFCAFSVIVAILSIFGMATQVAFDTADRKPEWGVRLSLGSSLGALRRYMATRLVAPVLIGAIFGLVLFVGLYRFFPVAHGDFELWQILSSLLLIVGIVLLSLFVSWRLSFRITKLHPSAILRNP